MAGASRVVVGSGVPQDVDAIQRGFGGDLLGAAGDGQVGVGDREVEVFAHLVFAITLPSFRPIRSALAKRPSATAVTVGASRVSVASSSSARYGRARRPGAGCVRRSAAHRGSRDE